LPIGRSVFHAPEPGAPPVYYRLPAYLRRKRWIKKPVIGGPSAPLRSSSRFESSRHSSRGDTAGSVSQPG
jgi:hypothetical protein